MGKRKKATKPPPKKKRAKLNKHFDCPFCGHEGTVDCYLERDENLGRVECRVCGAKFRAIINHLDEEVDLYHKWIDACEEASKEDKAPMPNVGSGGGGNSRGSGSGGGGGSPKDVGRRASSDRAGRLSSGSGGKRERTSIDFDVHDDDGDFDDEADDDLS